MRRPLGPAKVQMIPRIQRITNNQPGAPNMKTQLTTHGALLMHRRPRRALGLGLLAASALRGLSIAEARRRSQQLVEPTRRAASDPRVHAETRRAKADAVRAVHRVQQIGIARALTDRRVARKLRHATHHASQAASLSIDLPRRHRIRDTTMVVVASGTLAGGAYAARHRLSTPAERTVPSEATDVPSVDENPPEPRP